MPFPKHWPGPLAVRGHPAPEISPGHTQQPRITADGCGNPPVLGGVDLIEDSMARRGTHGRNLTSGGHSGEAN